MSKKTPNESLKKYDPKNDRGYKSDEELNKAFVRHRSSFIASDTDSEESGSEEELTRILEEDSGNEKDNHEQESILKLREDFGGSSISQEKMGRSSTLESSSGKRDSSTFYSGTTDIDTELPTSLGRVGTYPEEASRDYSDGHKKLRTERVENSTEEESKNYSDRRKKPRFDLGSQVTSSVAPHSSMSSEFFTTEMGEPLTRTSSTDFSSLKGENEKENSGGKRKR